MAAISEFLDCPLCMDPFEEPRILPCGHSFCLHCLQTLEASGERPMLCPTCRKPCPDLASNLPINYQFRELITSLIETNRKDSLDEAKGKKTISKQRFYSLLINLAFSRATGIAFGELAAHVKLQGRPNVQILYEQKSMFANVSKMIGDEKSVDPFLLSKWVETEKSAVATNSNVTQTAFMAVVSRIDKLKSVMHSIECQKISHGLDAETIVEALAVIFFAFLYHGLEDNETRFTERIVEEMKKRHPQRFWICCIGNFGDSIYYDKTLIRIRGLFNRTILLYDLSHGNEFSHQENAVKIFLDETVKFYESESYSIKAIQDKLEAAFQGKWHCFSSAIKQAKFSANFSEPKRVRDFSAENSQRQIRAFLITK